MKSNIITDKEIRLMISGIKSNYFLRNGFCGKDIRSYDLSNLSIEMFKKISFDSNTIFSDRQIKRFKPFEILEDAKSFGKSIDSLHTEGLKGKGVKIAVIDSNIQKNHNVINDAKVDFVEDELSGEEEVHGLTVLSALLEVAPDVQVTYYADNKYNQKRDDRILKYINDIVDQKDIKIISMSSRIKDKSIQQEVNKLLLENNITLIDSSEFYKNFTYCFKSMDSNGNEILEEAFCEEDISKESFISKKEQLQKLMNRYEISGDSSKEKIELLKLKLKSENKEEILNRIEQLEEELVCEEFEGENGFVKLKKDKLVEQEKDERRENKSIEIPCGGRTFATENNIYKYFSTCSASYTIPQLTALFAISRQVNSNLEYKDFVNACRETAINIDGRRIISAAEAISKIKDISKKNQFVDVLKNNVNAEVVEKEVGLPRDDNKVINTLDR